MKRALSILLLVCLALAVLLPLWWTFIGSLLSEEAFYAHYSVEKRPAFFTLSPTFDQYRYHFKPNLFGEIDFLRETRNSLIITAGIVIIHPPLAAILGYCLAKCRFYGRGMLNFLILMSMLAPLQVTITPSIILMRSAGLYDTFWALWLPGFSMPFGIFLMRQFMLSIPNEVLDAAQLETGNPVTLIFRIAVPMAWPAVLALLLLTTAEAWNMVEQPLLLLRTLEMRPLSLSVNDLTASSANANFAASVMYAAPMIVLFLLLRKQLIHALSNIEL